VRHGEIDRFDALFVVIAVGNAVETPDGVGGALLKFDFERLDEALEKIKVALSFASRSALIAYGLTRLLNTMGRRPVVLATSRIWRAQSRALGTVSMKGARTCWKRVSGGNCASRLWPSVSTVMPVPSETKNTVRMGRSVMGRLGYRRCWLRV
jgi:hypothetical protein